MSDLPDLLTAAETADYLRMTIKGLYKMNHANSGPPRIKVGRQVLYRRRDLEKWLDDQTMGEG